MKDAPKGFRRNEKGVLEFAPIGIGGRREHTDEAVWFRDGYGERFGCAKRIMKGFHAHICGKTAKHDPDENGNPRHCGTHSDAAYAKRKAKSDARYAAQKEAWKRRDLKNKLRQEAMDIVRQIAEGHNDGRGLCMDWVRRMDE